VRFNAAVDAKRIAPEDANEITLALSALLVPLNYQRGSRWRRDLGLTGPAFTGARNFAGSTAIRAMRSALRRCISRADEHRNGGSLEEAQSA